ncbi:Cys-tRNA(Pro) deacylase [Thiohalocapsa marina]|uniref:Cys-tRNA(Pro)/Cys-tRNA(Cys) deacylase n=1 Tax=Thiohalocapsa marina TaxID=424902 RepID=A0A5M8FFV5_9GAMM|nr:Cys-tRNA(Pro) deacylase [Thiohalocapsa marina]KAA6183587.1 Cys-tRNA(Pro) deacylase [Thiohalocapsa marina]
MAGKKEPVTQAVRVLRAQGIAFQGYPYDYNGGGTAEFAAQLGVDEHQVIKTLIMEDEQARPLIVLMHGDREVATGKLAKQIGAKRIRPCEPKVADRHSGYQVGGTSPFGTRRPMPVYCERSIAGLDRIYINGGKRGYIIAIAMDDLQRVLQPTLVDAAQ